MRGSAPVDLLLHGGVVLDGSGAAPRLADVAVHAGRIADVGPLDGLRAERTIDVSGLCVSPGFVDMHSHADLILLGQRAVQEKLLAAKIAQGVTTVVVGNCGLGVAPSSAAAATTLAEINGWMTPHGVSAGALSVRDYLDRLDGQGVALNAATLVPHGPVRVSVMGLAPGVPTSHELRAMASSVACGLDEGAFGLSVGLIYPPGMYSATDELVALAEMVAGRNALFTSHVRGSSETLLEATRELIEIARRSGARVHHSHVEAVGSRFWQRVGEALALEDQARARGLTVSHDVFLYTRAATMMTALFPPWALAGGAGKLLDRLREPETRARLARELAERVPEWPPWLPGGWPHNLVEAVGWDGIRVASVGSRGPSHLVGRSLGEIARTVGRDPFDVLADLMISEKAQVGQQVDEITAREDEPERLLGILAHPRAAVISDAEDYGRGAPHPAHAGAFARALRLNREVATLPAEELVRRMTSYPASLVGLEDRGVVRPGAWADLVAFDPLAVSDRATWTAPRETAEGIPWVIVNGQVVVDEGRYTGGLYGQVLRRPPSAGASAAHRH